MAYYTSAEACKAAGVSPRQLRYWVSRGYVEARFRDRRDGALYEPEPQKHYGHTGLALVLNDRGLATAVALAAVTGVVGAGSHTLGRAALALDRLALEDWPGRMLVLTAHGASIDGSVGLAALVVDLGACAAAGKAHEAVAS